VNHVALKALARWKVTWYWPVAVTLVTLSGK